MRNDHPILVLCLHLEVSASGYYDWQRRRLCPGPRAVEDQALAQEIDQIHTRSRQTYGAPRVEKELRKKGRCHGRNRVARLMRQKGLCGRQKGRYRVQTTDSNHDQPIAPNRLAQAPKATAPNQLWVADITYIETQEGWLLHSDRGIQYASGDYRQALGEAGLIASMSRRGNCYDNATMESFWATLKLELVYRRCFDTRAQARTQIFDYIETFYNRQRAHSALDYHSPVDFEVLNN